MVEMDYEAKITLLNSQISSLTAIINRLEAKYVSMEKTILTNQQEYKAIQNQMKGYLTSDELQDKITTFSNGLTNKVNVLVAGHNSNLAKLELLQSEVRCKIEKSELSAIETNLKNDINNNIGDIQILKNKLSILGDGVTLDNVVNDISYNKANISNLSQALATKLGTSDLSKLQMSVDELSIDNLKLSSTIEDIKMDIYKLQSTIGNNGE